MASKQKGIRKAESEAYGFLGFINDVLSIINGTEGRRLGRRAYGRASGRVARKLFG